MRSLASALLKTSLIAYTFTWGVLPAQAQVNAPPIVFQQATIKIHGTKQPAAVDLTDKLEKSFVAELPAEPHTTQLKVSIRPAEALGRRDYFTLTPFQSNDGMMFIYGSPMLGVPSAPFIQQPVDILTINHRGVIEEILPNTIPAHLDSQAAVDSPILAVLFLKAGTVDAEEIKPKDNVEHSLFNPAPEIRQ